VSVEKLKAGLSSALSVRMSSFARTVSQSDINSAIWESLTGQGAGSFEALTRKWDKIPLPSQIYFYAAMTAGKRVAKENVSFINDLNSKTNLENAAKDSEIKIADGVVGSVAALVNVIPVVGQAASAIIAIGYALSRLVYSEGLRIELRKGEDQIRKSYAGDGLGYKGILLSRSVTKQVLDENIITQSLPLDVKGQPFDFYVSLSDIEAAAEDMGIKT
jgi:hypothetical protein